MFERVGAFVDDVNSVGTQVDLRTILAEIARELGFTHFALSHHVDIRSSSEPAIRIHNYPDEWERYYDRHHLGRTDPVHRACQTTAVGFTWSQLPRMIPLTRRDHRLMEAAAKQGPRDRLHRPGSCARRGQRLLLLRDGSRSSFAG